MTAAGSPPALSELVKALLHELRSLAAVRSPRGPEPGADAELLLASKVIPELDSRLALPVFVGILGGTNTGKSTVLNALAGRLLSPALVTGSSTKHPLLWLHEKWRTRFLEQTPFPGTDSRELADPKELIVEPERLDLLYFRFHDDPRLAAVAFIDSPDLDGTLETNAAAATRIAAIADVAVFVTTAQKYADRVLVAALGRLLDLKTEVIVIANMVDEEIVFATLVEDLRRTLGARGRRLRAIRAPWVRASRPEEALRALLADQVLDPLSRLDPARAKPPIVARSIRLAVRLAGDFAAQAAGEARVRRDLEALLANGAREAQAAYRSGFRLAFPEETLAIRRILELTEMGPRLELGPEVERSSLVLNAAGALVRRVNDGLRRLVARLSPSQEGAVVAAPGAIAEYTRARNRSDAENVARLVADLRGQAEGFLRAREPDSSFAGEVLRARFAPAEGPGFLARTRDSHLGALAGARDTGDDLAARVEHAIALHPRRARAMGLAAIAGKVAAGVLAAWVLPPSLGLLGFLHPLNWLYFGLGYLAAAYAIALGVALRVRGRKRFAAAREELMAATLRAALLDPLHAEMDRVLPGKSLRELDRVLGAIREHPELESMDQPSGDRIEAALPEGVAP
jgi:hypothetical protein